MNEHKLDGERCIRCGQAGLELEDECPVDMGTILKTPAKRNGPTEQPEEPARVAASPRLGSMASKINAREVPKRRSFNQVQNDDRLDMIARALMSRIPEAIKHKQSFTGADLKQCFAAYNMEARHTDQCDAGL